MSNTPAGSDAIANGTEGRFWDQPEQFLRGERQQHVVGFVITLAAFALSLGVCYLVQQDRRHPWLRVATSLFDISLVTVAQVAYAFVSDPQVVVNSKITFDVYFVALAGTCMAGFSGPIRSRGS